MSEPALLKTLASLTRIAQLHDLYDAKQVSVGDVTRAFLAACQASKLNATLTLCTDRALAQACAADERLHANGGRVPREQEPLFGVPMGIKDALVVEGIRTTCASRILEDYIPPYTATCVERLERAGAITLAKLNLDEFAMGGSNENSAFGPVEHPTHPGRVPGGSSGGSACAVRANLCFASLGSDTGGSIRLPASYCGVTGVKPTYGRVSRFGLVAFASSLDQVGPLTRSVEDAAILLEVLSGHDPLDSTTSGRKPPAWSKDLAKPMDWKGLRVGVSQEAMSEGLSPAVRKTLDASLATLEAKGVTLVPVSLPHAQHAVAVYYIVAVSEASSNLSRMDGTRFGVRPPAAEHATKVEEFYTSVRALFGPEVKRRILLGTFALSSGYSDQYFKKACQVRRLIAQDFDRAFECVDVIAGPVSVSTAFRLGEKSADPLGMYLNDLFTIPANLAGLPALSVPAGVDEEGLPIGLHLMAPQFEEARILEIAHAVERSQLGI